LKHALQMSIKIPRWKLDATEDNLRLHNGASTDRHSHRRQPDASLHGSRHSLKHLARHNSACTTYDTLYRTTLSTMLTWIQCCAT